MNDAPLRDDRRMTMRLDLDLDLERVRGAPALPLRAPRDEDRIALARLMLAAYAGTTDDEGGTEADALAEVDRTFAGGYGAFLGDMSRVVEVDGRIASAALVTRWRDRPLLAFSMTLPDCKRRGLARACLLGAIDALRAAGERELVLVVTRANEAAVRLYEGLGFGPFADPP